MNPEFLKAVIHVYTVKVIKKVICPSFREAYFHFLKIIFPILNETLFSDSRSETKGSGFEFGCYLRAEASSLQEFPG